MSDFFSDDFTAELKAYFLTSVKSEIEKFRDLIDDKTWKRIHTEIKDQCSAWSVDAKTNEFQFFSEWLASYATRCQDLSSPDELLKSLDSIHGYVVDLEVSKTDSVNLANKFSQVALNTHEIQYLHCRAGDNEFAVPLLSVIEISAHLPHYPLPQKQKGLLGVVPFRGEALPILHLVDFGFRDLGTESCYYLVCEQNKNKFCLQVTATENILNIKESDLQNLNDENMMSANPVVKNFFIIDSKSIMVLDLEKLVAA